MKNKFLLTLFSIIFILLMIFSTSIIESYINRDIDLLEYVPLEQDNLGTAFIFIDSIELIDDMYDIVSVYGNVYNISSATDDESTRTMILSSEQRSYSMKLNEVDHWARRLYEAIDINQKIQSGFSNRFSALTIKDGEYKVLFQIEENDVPVARAETGYYLLVENGHAYIEYLPSNKEENFGEIISINENMLWSNSGLNEVTLDEEGNLNITGWSIIDGVNSTDVNTYVEVKNEDGSTGVYSTTKEQITYIAEYFDNDLYFGAGFRASIPVETTEEIKIYVYSEYGGEIYQNSYHFRPINNNLDSFESISDINQIVDNNSYETSNQYMGELNYNELANNSLWSNSGIDSIDILENGLINIRGWNIIEQVNSSDIITYVEVKVDGISMGIYETQKEETMYLSEYFESDLYLNSGFSLVVDNANESNIEIYIYAKYEDEVYRNSYHFMTNTSNYDTIETINDIN